MQEAGVADVLRWPRRITDPTQVSYCKNSEKREACARVTYHSVYCGAQISGLRNSRETRVRLKEASFYLFISAKGAGLELNLRNQKDDRPRARIKCAH